MSNQFSPITLGERLTTINIAGFVLTETTHRPNHELPHHNHELTNIAFVLNGSFTEILRRRSIECFPQSLLIKPAGEAHANRYGSRGMRGLLIEIEPRRLETLRSWSKSLGQVSHLRGGASSIAAMRIYRELRLMDEASPLAIEGLMLEMVADLSRRSNLFSERKPPSWLGTVKEILHARFCESLSLAEIAGTVEVHPVHLARAFRKFYGCTLGEYLRSLRIEFCCRKLSTSDMPLAQIALEAGFSSQSHFSRLFKRHVGMTSTEFRSLYRLSR